MAQLDFPVNLHSKWNLTGTDTPMRVESRRELIDALQRETGATRQSAENFAEQILGGAEVNLEVRDRQISLYATKA